MENILLQLKMVIRGVIHYKDGHVERLISRNSIFDLLPYSEWMQLDGIASPVTFVTKWREENRLYMVVMVDESLYQITGYYDSWDGGDTWDAADVIEVEAEECTVIRYNAMMERS